MKGFVTRTSFEILLRGGAAFCIGALLVSSIFAEDDPEKPDFADELPRIAPLSPDRAMASFQLEPGFELQQVAHEPLVADPVAMCFDEEGRLFVVEMRGYPLADQDNLGLVRILEDSDEDGVFDKSSIFVDQLSWPTAIHCWDGGVFIGAAPDILYCKDTNGDGKADVRRRLFTGFGKQNVQGLFNSFRFGLDNRIYVAASSNGGVIQSLVDGEAEPINVRGRDFVFDPRTFEFESISGGAQHGMSFDDWGRRFETSNSDHLQMIVFDDRYIARNPKLPAPRARLSIAEDGPQAPVFRTSPVEPWRIVRTRLRVKGAIPGPVEGGGTPAGYFTGATAVTIYRGDAFPESYRGSAFIGDVGSNLVHRKVLVDNGVTMIGRHVDERREFLSSTDIWFRPVQYANAPDGALYIMDMYREVIEHPASLVDDIKKHLDLSSGMGMGRIYRVVPHGFKQPTPPRMGEATTAELVALLERDNGWHRDTASRLLYERQDHSAVDLLRDLVRESHSPKARMHALYLLHGLDGLDEASVLHGLHDKSPHVREHAVRLTETFDEPSQAMLDHLLKMSNDPAMRVRYQLAFSLGEINDERRWDALATILNLNGDDSYVRLAVFSSLSNGMDVVFMRLLMNEPWRQSDQGIETLQAMVEQLIRQDGERGFISIIEAINELPASDLAVDSLLVAAARGVGKDGDAVHTLLLQSADGRTAIKAIEKVIASSIATVKNDSMPIHERTRAVELLRLAQFDRAETVLAPLIDARQPLEVQAAAVRAISSFTSSRVGHVLVRNWSMAGPSLRVMITDAMFTRHDRLPALLDAVEQGKIAAGQLGPQRIEELRKHSDESIRDRASALFADVQIARRHDVVKQYSDALQMKGDVVRGRAVFENTCAICHQVGGVGHEIGPNLAAMKSRGPEAILLNVLDPNREVNPQYVSYTIETEDLQLITGMIASESATSVTLVRGAEESTTVLRDNIAEMRSGGLSIMPEGLESSIDKQAMADLISFLMQSK